MVDPAVADPLHSATASHPIDLEPGIHPAQSATRSLRQAPSIARTVANRNGSKRAVALIIVIIMTIFAIAASGLKASDDQAYGGLHTFALVVMVASYIFYLSALRKPAVERRVSVQPGPDGESFIIAPYWPGQFVCPGDQINTTQLKSYLQGLSATEKKQIAAVQCNGSRVDLPFLRLLASIPNLVALDLQNCNVDPAIWDQLVHFDELKLILAYGTVSPDQLRDLALTIPEIKICITPSRLISNRIEWGVPDEPPETSLAETRP